MKKWLLSALFLATTSVYAQTPAQIVQQSYPNYSNQLQCRIAKLDDRFYCMRLLRSETRTTEQGKLMYLLYGGNAFDPETENEVYAHVANGLAGMFVFREKAVDNWELLAQSSYNVVGSSGMVPEKSEWSFHEFGPNKWGFLTTHNDAHQGRSSSHYVLLVHDGNGSIIKKWIGRSYSDEGALLMSPPFTNLEAELRIKRDATYPFDYHTLQMTVSGNEGRTKFRNRVFEIHFDTRVGTYIEPRGYPLIDTFAY